MSGGQELSLIVVKVNGDEVEVEEGSVLEEVYHKWRGRTGRGGPVAAKMNGRLVDLSSTVEPDAEVEFIWLDSPEGLEILRHSTSHIMAQAVQELFPGAKITIGPAVEDGFYYDFDYDKRTFTPDDLPVIEDKMKEIISRDLKFVREEVPKDEAIRLFRERGEDYKVEILEEIPDGERVSLYWQGDWVDLCRGPHLPSTGWIRSFKLTSVAGAYWRGDERNKMLQRIYGTAFPDDESLAEYLKRIEEAKRRDHRRLGKELDLFQINEEAGPGLVIFHPNGALLRMLIEDFEKKEHLRRGYNLVMGPQLLKLEMWERSGHLENYRQNMYFTEIEGQAYGIKPMNCLAHMLIYKSRIRSYRDLPIRYFELGTVHRHEKTGVLHGLIRVRQFTQDDAHILCRPDQLKGEITGVLNFVMDMMKVFDFEYEMELSTRPEKSIGTDEEWESATSALKESLEAMSINFRINEGEGAFYGPKIDVHLRDVLGRKWQCGTIQCDFTMPERFELYYIGEDGEKHRPVMIHRTLLGSMERFIGILIEHYAGAFPIWLAPIQAVVMNITDDQKDYAMSVAETLSGADIRVKTDLRNEKLGFKIREAQLQKIPYMLVAGKKEKENGTIAPRLRDGTQLEPLPVDELVKRIKEESEIPFRKVGRGDAA